MHFKPLVKSFTLPLWFCPLISLQIFLLVHACNSSTWKDEAGGSWVWGKPGSHKDPVSRGWGKALDGRQSHQGVGGMSLWMPAQLHLSLPRLWSLSFLRPEPSWDPAFHPNHNQFGCSHKLTQVPYKEGFQRACSQFVNVYYSRHL